VKNIAVLPLFERLIDDDLLEKRDEQYDSNISLDRLKESILNSLTLLLNTRIDACWKNCSDQYDEPFPFAFGVNLTAPKAAETVFEIQDLEKSVLQTISRFEPRLKNVRVEIEPNLRDASKATVHINADVEIHDMKTRMTFPILMEAL